MIVDATTRDIISDPDPSIFEQARARATPHRVVNEFLRSQIETNSRICRSVAEIAQSLRETREAVIAAARAQGARVIASSTHPWARWEAQQVTEKPRYRSRRGRVPGHGAPVLRRRHAHPRRVRGSRPAHRGHGCAAPVSALHACIVGILALPRRTPDGTQVSPPDRDRGASANRPAAGDAKRSRVRKGCRDLSRDRSDRRRERAALGHPPLGDLPHHRAPHLRHLPAHRRRGGDLRALCMPHSGDCARHPGRQSTGPSSARDHRGEPLARAALRDLRLSAHARRGRITGHCASRNEAGLAAVIPCTGTRLRTRAAPRD